MDAYLLLHALASSSEPHQAEYPVATWVQLLRLDETATTSAASSRWSKVVTRLTDLRLVDRTRIGNHMQYVLLDECGDQSPYVRPRTGAQGPYFKLPHSYWADGYDITLTQPEKLMLLIGLDQQEGFKLPFNQTKAWYGVSENTARRGLRGLSDRGLVTSESTHELSPKSPTGWAEIIRYTMTGPFSSKAIAKAVKSRGKTVFTTTEPRP